MIVYHVRLRLGDVGGVVGTWEAAGTADRKYRQWLGLYGSVSGAALELVEDVEGRERVLKTWTTPELPS